MPDLTLRPATPEDADLLFAWANDSLVRANSYHSAPVPYARHVAWLAAKLADPAAELWIAEEAGTPVGQVRFDASGQEAVIGVLVAPQARGRGMATRLLRQACAAYRAAHPGRAIHAYIKNENEASLRAFAQAGFMFSRYVEMHGCPSQLFVYSK